MGARRQEGAWLIIMPSIPSFASILRISTKSQRHTLVFLAMNSLDYSVTFILGSPRHSLDFELLYINHHIFSWYVLLFLLISTCLLFCLREYP